MPYIAYNDGLNIDLVGPDYILKDGEVLFKNTPKENELLEAFPNYNLHQQKKDKQKINDDIIKQIETLETKQHRAVREFILTGNIARIQEFENQISILRAQIQK